MDLEALTAEGGALRPAAAQLVLGGQCGVDSAAVATLLGKESMVPVE